MLHFLSLAVLDCFDPLGVQELKAIKAMVREMEEEEEEEERLQAEAKALIMRSEAGKGRPKVCSCLAPGDQRECPRVPW